MAGLKHTIIETLLVYPGEGKYHKELNIIEWGSHRAKYDLRNWNKDRSEMTKGVTFTPEELKLLIETLEKLKL